MDRYRAPVEWFGLVCAAHPVEEFREHVQVSGDLKSIRTQHRFSQLQGPLGFRNRLGVFSGAVMGENLAVQLGGFGQLSTSFVGGNVCLRGACGCELCGVRGVRGPREYGQDQCQSVADGCARIEDGCHAWSALEDLRGSQSEWWLSLGVRCKKANGKSAKCAIGRMTRFSGPTLTFQVALT